MSISKSQLFVLSIVILLLAACGQGPITYDVDSVESAEVMTTLQYVQGIEQGPAYNISLTVPDTWVGEVATRNEGNVLYFDYLGAGEETAPIFSIEALSPTQYWKQAGGYPGYYTNIVNQNDTYFVYHLPIDAYYSGLSAETFAALSQSVPEIVATFNAEMAN